LIVGTAKDKKCEPRAGSEAVDGVDESHGGDLDYVLQRLTAVDKSAGDVFGQRKGALDELIAEPVALRIVGSQLGIAALPRNQTLIIVLASLHAGLDRARHVAAGCRPGPGHLGVAARMMPGGAARICSRRHDFE
jgi:hypothetical protein